MVHRFFEMTIRRQLWLISWLSLGLVLVVGLVGLRSTEAVVEENGRIVTIGAALRLQMQADMMHDALRSDVLAGLLAGVRSQPEAQKQVQADLAEHLQTFEQALTELNKLPLSDSIRTAVGGVRPALAAYGASAKAVVGVAATDAEAALAKQPEFDASFKRLEDEMEALSQRIEKAAQDEQDAGVATAKMARWLIGGAALIGGVALYTLCAWIALRVATPLRHAVGAAQAVADGDLSRPIEVAGGGETRLLLSALEQMQRNLSNMVGTLRISSESIATGSAEIASGSADLSHRT
jgi:methyl-accepting chemotaxis protein